VPAGERLDRLGLDEAEVLARLVVGVE